MQMAVRRIFTGRVASTPTRFLDFDLGRVGCHGIVDEDVVVDDTEAGGEDVEEADDDEKEDVGEEEQADWILETEGH